MLATLPARRREVLIMIGSPRWKASRARIPVVETWDLPADPMRPPVRTAGRLTVAREGTWQVDQASCC
jgi:hypothetical protein